MLLRLLLAAAATSLLGGCYLLEAARGQLDLNARRVPIERLLAAAQTPPALRTQLALAARVRDFASHELALPDNDSYRAYADVGRPFVVWNVFAAPEFAIEPHTWCFPVAGCVAYRGYFSEQRARAYALGLEAQGFDVTVTGVPAYSTLGHFADPLLSTMLRWDETELAALVFHELAHQLLYVADDTAFNEAFATVVEREGVRRWLDAERRPEALAEYQARQARYRAVAALVAAGRARLQALYGRDLPVVERRAAKAEEFARLRAEYRATGAATAGYEWLFDGWPNNARLLAVATYDACVPALERALTAAGGELARFYESVRALARLEPAARHAACGAAGAG
jgi:predicted aminopeptidase